MINYHKPEVKHEIARARLLCVDSILGYLEGMVKFQLGSNSLHVSSPYNYDLCIMLSYNLII